MNIELGKTYRTRGGGKARVICVDAKNGQPIIALHLHEEGYENAYYHNHDGQWLEIEKDDKDIISEWTDKPTYDPATFPKWKWAAVDADGEAFVFTEKPERGCNCWYKGSTREGSARIPTPKDYNGDWENSLAGLP